MPWLRRYVLYERGSQSGTPPRGNAIAPYCFGERRVAALALLTPRARCQTAPQRSLIDLVIYFACVSAGQSPPVIRSLGPAFLFHLCECLLGLQSTMRCSSRQVIVTHIARLFLHHSNPANWSSGASVNDCTSCDARSLSGIAECGATCPGPSLRRTVSNALHFKVFPSPDESSGRSAMLSRLNTT